MIDLKEIMDEEDVERFEQMFQTGSFDFSYCSAFGENVLHYAALTGNLNRVKELLEQGADVNVKAREDWTLLHSAARSGNLELV